MRGRARDSSPFNSIIRFTQHLHILISTLSQWISSLLFSPSPPTLPRLSQRPPLPSMPMVEEAAVLAAALSPRRFSCPSNHLYRTAPNLLITDPPPTHSSLHPVSHFCSTRVPVFVLIAENNTFCHFVIRLSTAL